MKIGNPDELFKSALEALKERSHEVDLSTFEHHVWSEIAIREEHGRWLQRLLRGRFLMAPAATAGFAVIAIVAGVSLGFSRADAYGTQASHDLEQRYVESIHPMMMSAAHTIPRPLR